MSYFDSDAATFLYLVPQYLCTRTELWQFYSFSWLGGFWYGISWVCFGWTQISKVYVLCSVIRESGLAVSVVLQRGFGRMRGSHASVPKLNVHRTSYASAPPHEVGLDFCERHISEPSGPFPGWFSSL